jgi:hypothetical protein
MDPRLAELYGTNQPDQADLEKLAAAEFADGLTEEGSINLDDLDPEQLEAMAQEVLGGEGEEGEESDEDMEKLSEADYLGRVMAHSYVQELREIEKVAGPIGNSMAKDELKKYKERMTRGERVSSFLRQGKEKAKDWGRKGAGHMESGGRRVTRHIESGLRNLKNSGLAQDVKKGAKAVGRGIQKHQGKLAVGGAALAAAEGGRRYMKKHSSAFETLAEQRANEILENSQVEETTGYDVLQAAVEQRAAEILAENGYSVE